MDGRVLIQNAEIAGRCLDLRCEGGLIIERADRLEVRLGERILEAHGGALLPGLHDHHFHLFAMAAKLTSIDCGPPEVDSRDAFAERLRRGAPNADWLRGTGYFESVAGPLDRNVLDGFRSETPLRIQHRSGAMWFLNSRAIRVLDLDGRPTPSGVERDSSGRATGRLFRVDEWLRAQLPASAPPQLSAVGSMLARYGVTRVTDATPGNGQAEVSRFRRAQQDGALPQRLRVMGDASLSTAESDGLLEIAEYKIMLDEPQLPELDELASRIAEAHRSARNVAIHTVTRAEIHFALAAIEAVGSRRGDRLEHASVAPPEILDLAKRLDVSIVTQPNFIAERGDAYRAEVEPRDLPYLYRVGSWVEADIPLAGGTDAPFGHPDPWRAIRAAVTRRTRSGETLGQGERVSPELALDLFSNDRLQRASPNSEGPCPAHSDSTNLRHPVDRLQIGRPADLCLLDAPWQDIRDDLSHEHVVATLCSGEIAWNRED
jgi:predicted amidohydrolase YtcJ